MGAEDDRAILPGLALIRLQEKIPDVGSGKVDAGADSLKGLGALQKIAADFVVGGLNLVQCADTVEFGEGHQDKQATESREENGAGRYTPAHYGWRQQSNIIIARRFGRCASDTPSTDP